MATIYIWKDQTYNKIPNPLHLDDGSTISPVSEETFLANGGEIEDDGQPTHWEEFEAACDNFVAVCNAIGQFIGDPSFQGGITEMQALANSEAAQQNPVQALMLAEQWNGANLACNHWANKEDVNLPSPAWWWYCWSRYAEQLAGGR